MKGFDVIIAALLFRKHTCCCCKNMHTTSLVFVVSQAYTQQHPLLLFHKHTRTSLVVRIKEIQRKAERSLKHLRKKLEQTIKTANERVSDRFVRMFHGLTNNILVGGVFLYIFVVGSILKHYKVF